MSKIRVELNDGRIVKNCTCKDKALRLWNGEYEGKNLVFIQGDIKNWTPEEYCSGDVRWVSFGPCHTKNGPAIERKDNWVSFGPCHTKNGPAIERPKE